MIKILRITSVILLACLFIPGKAQDPGKKMSQKELALLVDSISANLKRCYVFPDKAILMANAVKTNFKNGVYAKIKDRLELGKQLTSDIQHVHTDKHFYIRYAPEEAQQLIAVIPDSILKKENDWMIKDARDNNFGFRKTEILPGNIGYIRWDEFNGLQEALPTINGAFQFVAGTRALIIDMCYNGGGWREAVLTMQNYFFDKRTALNHTIDNHNDTLKFYSDPSKTNFKLSMPVYILTSRGTFSGAEDFTYGLKHAGRAIVVGDTTGGGAHVTGHFSLSQGFVASIPLGRGYNETTKTDWERSGVSPDIAIKWQNALSKTRMVIYKDLMMRTDDPEEKYKFQWELNVLENKVAYARQIETDSVKYTKEQLQHLCGRYTPTKPDPLPVTILIKGNHIYRHIDLTGVRDERLTPIGNNRFVYDDESGRFADFRIDKDGQVTGLTIT